MSNKRECVSLKTLAAILGIPCSSIQWLLRSGTRDRLTTAEAEFVVSFHQRLTKDAEAARARIMARCEARGITPAEHFRQLLAECERLYPGETLSEMMGAESRTQELKQFTQKDGEGAE